MNFSHNETLTSPDTFLVFTKGLYVYGIPVICMFGILGNMLSFKVFVFTSFANQSSSSYIGALSLSDTGFLASLLLSWLGGGRLGVRYGHSPIWCHSMIYTSYVCSFLSVWYVVLIMIDRYIVVCHSLRVAECCTKRRARIATAIVTCFGLTFYAHTFFTIDVVGENCSMQFKPFMLKLISIFIYTDTAMTFVVPFAIIFFLNIIVITSIKRFQTRHIRSQNRLGKYNKNSAQSTITKSILSQAQFRITRTFTLVSVVLLVTNVPSHGIRFYILLRNLIHEADSVLINAQLSFQILYYFNFAVNFLLYSVSSDKFRKYLSYKYLCYFLYRRQRNRDNDHLYR